jgi:hypothetical protein
MDKLEMTSSDMEYKNLAKSQKNIVEKAPGYFMA